MTHLLERIQGTIGVWLGSPMSTYLTWADSGEVVQVAGTTAHMGRMTVIESSQYDADRYLREHVIVNRVNDPDLSPNLLRDWGEVDGYSIGPGEGTPRGMP